MAIATAPAPKTTRRAVQPDPHPQPRHGSGDAAAINVGETERTISLIAGGVLAALGLTRGSVSGLGLAALGGALLHRGSTGHCMGYSLLGINTSEKHGDQASIAAGHGVHFEQSVTVNSTPDEAYRFWRNFENLPRFMHYLESVKVTGKNTSHWIAKGPMGVSASWDAEIITERPGELIGWRSLDGSMVDTAGSVHFTKAPGGRGTEVKVVMKYNPPLGKAGAVIAGMFGRSAQMEVKEDLRRFKQLIETGVIATTQGQPQGACTGQMYEQMGRGLGWFSIGLGVAELVAPDSLARAIGVQENNPLMRFFGVREIVSGLGILASRNPAPFLWARVAGDIMDLAALGTAASESDADRGMATVAITSVLGVTMLDVMCAIKCSGEEAQHMPQ